MSRTYTPKVDRKYLTQAPPDKVSTGKAMMDGLSAHAKDYPDLPVPAETLATLNTKLSDAIADAKSGDRSKIAIRRQIEAEWKEQFGETTDYINTLIRGGNTNLITQLGLEPTKESSTTPSAPADATPDLCQSTQEGAVHISVKGGKGAEAFVAVLADAGGSIAASPDGTITVTTANGDKVYIKCETDGDMTLGNLAPGHKLQGLVQPVNHIGAGGAAKGMTVTPQ